jgi:hypothetical protein
MFRSNMLFIYGNTILIFFEMLDPVYGYFHGAMLSLALMLGYSLYGLVGSIVQKSVHRVYKIKGDDTRIKVEYLSYYKVINF